MTFFRHHGPYMVGAFAGFAAAASFCVMYFRLRQELAELRTLISQLREEILEGKRTGRLRYRRGKGYHSGYFSAATSSGDDDEDDFQDALAGGDTDVEGEVLSLASPSRSVQFASPLTAESDTIDEQFMADIDRLLSGHKADIEQAYRKLLEKKSLFYGQAEFQWRFAKATYNVANQKGEAGDADKKKELLYKAKDAAQAALRLDSSSPDAHKWYAITLGSVGDYEAMSEKIKNAVVIKDHIQMAIRLNPRDPTPHHMLGRWCYSVYMLTWLERKAASAFFGTPPTSTADEALEHFMQAENLNPGKWKENMLYIAKCLIEKREYDEAGVWLRSAAKGLEQDTAEADVKAEIRNLLAKYG